VERPFTSRALSPGCSTRHKQIGGAVGLAVLSVLAGSATTSALNAGETKTQAQVAGYHQRVTVECRFAVAASLAAIVLVRNRLAAHSEENRESEDEESRDGLEDEAEAA